MKLLWAHTSDSPT